MHTVLFVSIGSVGKIVCSPCLVNENWGGGVGQAVGGRDFCTRHHFFFPLRVKILCVHLLIPHMLLL